MQIAAQMKAPVLARACRGHHGTHFVPVDIGEGRWVYYWLSIPQAWFLRSRTEKERMELVRKGEQGCFVCSLQATLERETLLQE